MDFCAPAQRPSRPVAGATIPRATATRHDGHAAARPHSAHCPSGGGGFFMPAPAVTISAGDIPAPPSGRVSFSGCVHRHHKPARTPLLHNVQKTYNDGHIPTRRCPSCPHIPLPPRPASRQPRPAPGAFSPSPARHVPAMRTGTPPRMTPTGKADTNNTGTSRTHTGRKATIRKPSPRTNWPTATMVPAVTH